MTSRLPIVVVLGAGIMGGPMARRLAGAGLAVSAWNRTRSKAEALAEAGVGCASSVDDALAGADVAIVMLSTGAVIEAALFRGETPAVARLRPGSTLLVMSSIPVELAQSQAAAAAHYGVQYVDAPVSGGEPGAREGTLAIFAGGESNAVARLAPVFAPLGRVTHVGPVGSGQATKLANQIIVGGSLVAIAEAFTLAARSGASARLVRSALTGGFGDSKVLQVLGERMVERDFVPGSPATYQLKDLRAAREMAGSVGLRLTLLDTLATMFEDLVAHEGAGIDVSAIICDVERRSALRAA